MAIFLNADTKVIVQGMTGSEGMKHTPAHARARAPPIVGGVNPRKAGTAVDFDGRVVRRRLRLRRGGDRGTGADVSVIFVPPAFTKAAVVEAIDAQIPLAVVITEGVPVQDTAEFFAYAQEKGAHPHHRPELPRPDHARRRRTPASSRPTSPARPDRPRLASRAR